MAVAVAAALVGAWCYALAAALQHHEAARATTPGVANPRLLWHLAHRPLWLAGVGATGSGVGLHVLALSHGPLTLVQPLGVTELLFAIPLAAALRRHRVQRWELIAALSVVAGLGLLLSSLPLGSGTGPVGAAAVASTVAAAGILASAAAALSATTNGRLRPVFLAIAAGIAFGTGSALVRVLVLVWQLPGPTDTVSIVVAGVGLVVLAPLGFLLTQSAYRGENFPAALATIIVMDPLTGAVWGVLLLHEPLPATPIQTLTAASGALLVAVGVGALARSSTATPAPA